MDANSSNTNGKICYTTEIVLINDPRNFIYSIFTSPVDYSFDALIMTFTRRDFFRWDLYQRQLVTFQIKFSLISIRNFQYMNCLEDFERRKWWRGAIGKSFLRCHAVKPTLSSGSSSSYTIHSNASFSLADHEVQKMNKCIQIQYMFCTFKSLSNSRYVFFHTIGSPSSVPI